MDTEIQAHVQETAPVAFDEFPPSSYEEWRKEAETALKGAPFDKKMYTKTYEGITLEPLYTADHAKGKGWEGALPGVFPFLRGTDASGYIAAPWRIAQAVDAPLPEEANRILRTELEKGGTCVHLVLDRASRNGATPDLQEEERGVSICTLQDFDDVFREIDPTRNEMHIHAGYSAAPLLGLFAARLRAHGRRHEVKSLSGCVGADPLGSLAEEGSLPAPMDEIYDEMALSLFWAAENAPRMKTVLVRGDVYHDGGADAAREIACMAATGIAYLKAMLRRGVPLAEVAARTRFFTSVGANFFMEVAKIRALRSVWARIVKEFGGQEKECALDLFARTSAFTQSVRDPYVNMLRATSQAFAAVVGGVRGLHVACFDEAIRPSNEQSRRTARNIQLMLRSEFDLLQPVDPSGGSWYVETLTAQLAEKAWAEMQKIEGEGGMEAALLAGGIQHRIQGVLEERFKKLAVRSDRAVGTNMYANTTELPLEFESDNESLRRKRLEDIKHFVADVDEIHRDAMLAALPEAVGGEPERFVGTVTEAFLAGATIQEVRGALLDGATGGPRVAPVVKRRWTEQFEALRGRSDEYKASAGRGIRVFLASMGPVSQHKARADFTAGFMEAGNFEVLGNNGFASVDEAVAAASESGADVAVICSTDETYPELVPPLARGIKSACPETTVLLAGAPVPEMESVYREAGVDDFIHVRADCLRVLSDIQKKRGAYR